MLRRNWARRRSKESDGPRVREKRGRAERKNGPTKLGHGSAGPCGEVGSGPRGWEEGSWAGAWAKAHAKKDSEEEREREFFFFSYFVFDPNSNVNQIKFE